jgi:CBS domain-containing protein
MSITKAAWLMLYNRISGLPVVGKKGELIGIVTEGDFCGGMSSQRRSGGQLAELSSVPGNLTADDQIAKRVVDVLDWNTTIPKGSIQRGD